MRPPSGGAHRRRHDRIVPFHKLTQWLTYSLLEPLETAGLTVVNLDELTALPEYRNGGCWSISVPFARARPSIRKRATTSGRS